MGRKRKTGEPRVVRKDLPDPKDLPDSNDVRDPRKGDPPHDSERRRDPDARTGRPVQVGVGGAPPADLEWPEPSKDAQPQK
jgi:hypothetical protein